MATAKQIAARKKWQAAGAASRRGKKAIDRVAHINYGPVHNTTRLVGSRGNVSVSIMADTDNRGRHWRVKYTKMVPNNVNGRPVPITGFGGAFTNSRQARQSAKGLLDLMTREAGLKKGK